MLAGHEPRHCERSEAIQCLFRVSRPSLAEVEKKRWIASSLRFSQ
jgi:hypothetical protein